MINLMYKTVVKLVNLTNRFYTVVAFGAALSQDKSAHFYRYSCASNGYSLK